MKHKTGATRGFALIELLLAVAVLGLAVGIMATSFKTLKTSQVADDMAVKTVQLANDIRKYWRASGTFTTLGLTGLYKLGIAHSPMYIDSATFADAWSNNIAIQGADTYFALVMGGNGVMSPQECAAFATGMADASYEVRVGASVALGTGGSVGRTAGGYSYKANGNTFDMNALQTGCAEANTKVGVSFDG